MLLTGEEDFRTPISESEQYYQALKLRKVDTALVRIPGSVVLWSPDQSTLPTDGLLLFHRNGHEKRRPLGRNGALVSRPEHNWGSDPSMPRRSWSLRN
jgi:hypothetical protein